MARKYFHRIRHEGIRRVLCVIAWIYLPITYGFAMFYLKASHMPKTFESILTLFILPLIPLLAVYGFILTIQWVFAGFRKVDRDNDKP